MKYGHACQSCKLSPYAKEKHQQNLLSAYENRVEANINQKPEA